MSRIFIPAAFSRRTSLILRMGSFLLGTLVLPRMTTVQVVTQEGRVPALVDQGAAPTCCGSQVSGISRNGCPDWIGTSVRIRSESLSAFGLTTHLCAHGPDVQGL